MQLPDMVAAVNSIVDDVLAQSDAITWLNMGKDEMAKGVDASFPDIDGVNVLTYPFSSTKWKTLPILFAAAKFKEKDVMLDEANNFNSQFQAMLAQFVEKYEVPPQYRDHANVQQFVAQAGQYAFVITRETYMPDSARLQVYVNNRICTDWQLAQSNSSSANNMGVYPSQITTNLTTTNDPNGFIFNTSTTLNQGDLVTAEWQFEQDLNRPAYDWWSW